MTGAERVFLDLEVTSMRACRAIFTGTFDTFMFFSLAVTFGSALGLGVGYVFNDPCWGLDGAIGGLTLTVVCAIHGAIIGRFGPLAEDGRDLLGLRIVWGGILGTVIAGGMLTSPVSGGIIGVLCGLVASIPPNWSRREFTDLICDVMRNMPMFFLQLSIGSLKGLVIGLLIGLPFILIGLFVNSPEWMGIGAAIAIVACAAGASVHPIQLANRVAKSKSDSEHAAEVEASAKDNRTQAIIRQQGAQSDREEGGEASVS